MAEGSSGHPRVDVGFPSGDSDCRAWLYRQETAGTPLVILGHGLGATRELGLAPYAERFQDAGMSALCFTYRHFGDSGGEPRQLLDVDEQLEDWAEGLAFARTLPGIDPDRIAIWGSSFGGGHVIEVAARDGRVAAVVAQCPFTDGVASLKAAHPRSLAFGSVLAWRDELRRVRGSKPVKVPIVGPPGSPALMTAPDAERGYRALIPPGLPFDDEVAARFLSRVAFYRPGRSAAYVRAPILFCICERDSVAPAATALRYAAEAPKAEIKRYPIGHFDIYKGGAFEIAVADQLDFLRRHLELGLE
jgi:dienelactone hydrolase